MQSRESLLDQARRHVSEAEERVERQTRLVDELARDGHPTADAEALLATFRKTLRVMREHLAEEERHYGA